MGFRIWIYWILICQIPFYQIPDSHISLFIGFRFTAVSAPLYILQKPCLLRLQFVMAEIFSSFLLSMETEVTDGKLKKSFMTLPTPMVVVMSPAERFTIQSAFLAGDYAPDDWLNPGFEVLDQKA
jgi:hypothetical protein